MGRVSNLSRWRSTMKKVCPACGYSECYANSPICEKCEYTFRPIDKVARSVTKRCAQNEVAVVVPRKGLPSRVYGLDEYLKMVELATKNKPWTRKGKKGRTSEVARPAKARPSDVLPSIDADVQ